MSYQDSITMIIAAAGFSCIIIDLLVWLVTGNKKRFPLLIFVGLILIVIANLRIPF